MVLMSCGCDVDANALTLCTNCYAYFLRTHSVVYKKPSDQVNIQRAKGNRNFGREQTLGEKSKVKKQ